MAKSAIDAQVNNSGVFRKDSSLIIALRRDLATLSPIRLEYDAAGYKSGQVLAYDTGTSTYKKYAGVSGTMAAKCVLFEDVSSDEMGSVNTIDPLARGIFGGQVFTTKLLDYDANAATGLKSTDYVDAAGNQITKF